MAKEKKALEKKQQSNIKKYLLPLLIVVLLSLATLTAIVFWPKTNSKNVPDEFNEGFGQALNTKYKNPSETFEVRFPTQPNVIDVSFTGLPIINYYAVDPQNGDEFKISHIKDVTASIGVSPEVLLQSANRFLLKALAGEDDPENQGQFQITKSEKQTDGTTILEAEITQPAENKYALYKFIGKDNALMVISAGNNQSRKNTYAKFLKSFSWLKMENNDQGTFDLKQVETGEAQMATEASATSGANESANSNY